MRRVLGAFLAHALAAFTMLCGPTLSLAQDAQTSRWTKFAAWFSGRYIQLNWNLDEAGRGSTVGYRIYRGIQSTGPWECLTKDAQWTELRYIDFAPSLAGTANKVLYYRVTKVDLLGKETDAYGPLAVKLVGRSRPEITNLSKAPRIATATQGYDKNNIISNQQLLDATAVTAEQIQSFLSAQGSVLANFSENGQTAAQLIYAAAQNYGISPYVVLTTLQQQQGLITSPTMDPDSYAMGWNTKDPSTATFADQVNYGTRQFGLYYENLGNFDDVNGTPWAVGQAQTVSDGTVTAANIATAGLYIYTPWIGGGGGGAVGVGGNYLFWDVWYKRFNFGAEVASVPAIQAGQIFNAADYGPISPGATACLFGSNFASEPATGASTPLPTSLGGVSVSINGLPAPLIYVDSGQVNFQVPWETAVGTATVTVTVNGVTSNPATVPVLTAAPGLFFINGNPLNAEGQAAVQNSDYSLNAPSNPALAGTVITAYLTGSGPVNPPVTDGVQAPVTPLSVVTSTYSAMLWPGPVNVAFAGVTPKAIGMEQFNMVVPPGLATGNYLLSITINGQTSNYANVSVLANSAAAPSCAAYPAGFVPFSSINYLAGTNTAGDQLLVGNMSLISGGQSLFNSDFVEFQNLPLPATDNQQFCGSVSLANGYAVVAYVPTAAERSGNFGAFAGLLLDPLTNLPFPGGIIPANRLPNPIAWRIASVVTGPSPNLPVLTSIIINPTAVASAGSATITVTLSGAAPSPNGAAVNVSSSNPSAFPSSTLVVQPGQTSASTTITAGTVGGTATLTASYNGSSQSATVAVTPPAAAPVPSISGLSPTTAETGTFSLTINGSNFDISTAQIVITGPGCSTTTSCVVPNNVLTSEATDQIAGPATISNPGTYTIQVQNGAGAALSNGLPLNVQSGGSLQLGSRVMAACPAAGCSMASPGGTNVRNGQLADPPLFQQLGGVHGTVIGGPISGTADGFTGNWWEINWDSEPPNQNGQPGWSAESVLTLAPSAADIPQPNFSSSYFLSNYDYTSATNIFWPSNAPPDIPGALGNCTWYAFGRLLELGVSPTALSALHGNASEWVSEASGIFPLDPQPSAHDIAELDPTPEFPLGHVAIVESANPDGTITVTESSSGTDPASAWMFLWRHRTVSPTWFSNFIRVAVTVTAPVPTVSQVSPTAMTADNAIHTLTIYGANFQSGNIVQFMWSVPPNNGAWNTGGGNPPNIANAGQMTIGMNPGGSTDTIYVRVCRSASQTTSADCSSGAQYLAVTATAAQPTVSALNISPTTVSSGGLATVTVALSGAAPSPAGATVTLSSSNPSAFPPSTLFVPPGQRQHGDHCGHGRRHSRRDCLLQRLQSERHGDSHAASG